MFQSCNRGSESVALNGTVSFLDWHLACDGLEQRSFVMSLVRNSLTMLKEGFNQWWHEDRPFEQAAALAYYTLFSMAPLLVIAISVAGLVFGRASFASV